jgi:YhcH/YjgK/YiaL family protein
MVIDHISNWRKYNWSCGLQRAFTLLVAPEARQWPEGKVELDGKRIIAMPQEYSTRAEQAGRWEAHRKYIDIQYVVSGGERMGWAPVVSLAPETTFDVEKDVGFYLGRGNMLAVTEGMFAVFFPQDAHMPCINIGKQAQQVRKIVMKVAVEE